MRVAGRYLRKFLVAAVGLLAIVGALELVARAAFATLGIDVATMKPESRVEGETKSVFSPHPFLPYGGTPNAMHGKTSLNSLGFRGGEFDREKPSGVYRILAFGGSTTYGTASGDLPAWPEVLESKLNTADPGTRYEVYNLAVSGGCSAFSLVNLALHGVHFSPDVIIEYHGANDMWMFGFSSFKTDYSHCLIDYSPNASYMGFRYFAPNWFFKSRLATYALYRVDSHFGFVDRGSIWHQVFKDCDMPQDEDPFYGVEALLANIKTMRGISREYRSHFLGSTYLFRDHPEAEINERLRTFFEEEDIDFVDLERHAPTPRTTLHVDDTHFSEKGADAVAQIFAEKVLQIRNKNASGILNSDI